MVQVSVLSSDLVTASHGVLSEGSLGVLVEPQHPGA